jgi:L-rhamnose mutarotase
MFNFIDNIGSIDWINLRNNLLDKKGKDVLLNLDDFKSHDKRYIEIFGKLKDAGFNQNSARWINYYPGIDYSESISTEVQKFLNLSGIHRTWVSRIDPGYYAPWHWDVDDHEEEYLTKGKIKRYSVFLDPKEENMAHVFILENKAIFDTDSGDCYKWKSYDLWHAGMNGGLYPKFMFHVLGW